MCGGREALRVDVRGGREFGGLLRRRWRVFVWRHSDATPGRHAGGHEGVGIAVADVRKGAEEQAGDVGKSGGAARGDLPAGEKFVECGEGVVDALGVLEVGGVLGEESGKVLEVRWLKPRPTKLTSGLKPRVLPVHECGG